MHGIQIQVKLTVIKQLDEEVGLKINIRKTSSSTSNIEHVHLLIIRYKAQHQHAFLKLNKLWRSTKTNRKNKLKILNTFAMLSQCSTTAAKLMEINYIDKIYSSNHRKQMITVNNKTVLAKPNF